MSKPRKITISDEDIARNQSSNKPDIDDLLVKFRYAANKTEEVVAKQALYQLLASEAVTLMHTKYLDMGVMKNPLHGQVVEAIPISKLKEVFKIKE